MTKKCRNHTLQTNALIREEEANFNNNIGHVALIREVQI